MQNNHSQNQDKLNSVDLYVQFYSVSNFNSNRKTLQNIVGSYVKPTAPNTKLSVIPYYKPRKISSMFSTRQGVSDSERSNVVYQFNCIQDACNASYIGYTTQKLSNRVKQHRRPTSSICKHFTDLDGPHKFSEAPPWDQLITQFNIKFSINDVEALKIAEGIFIKQYRPSINIQNNESFYSLKLF